MVRRTRKSPLVKLFQSQLKAFTRSTQKTVRKTARTASRVVTKAVTKAATQAAGNVTRGIVKAAAERARPPPGAGDWIGGVALGPAGARNFHLYRPPGVVPRSPLPLLVMLHGCNQDAKSFAMSTRMNRLAAREGFFVLYPQQDLRANPQGCWNWYDTRSGLALAEAATIKAAIDQVALLYPIDRQRVAVAGMSAGASMAALLVTRYPDAFKAVAMHSGVPPGAAHSTATALSAMGGRRGASTLTPTATSPLPPLLVIHGGRDYVVSSHNGQAAVSAWAEASGARVTAARVVQRGERYPMTVLDFKVGRRTVVTLCEIAALGHAWSGGDAKQSFSDGRGPDATRLVWAFAAKQFER